MTGTIRIFKLGVEVFELGFNPDSYRGYSSIVMDLAISHNNKK
jgi:hypothetical protein